MVPQFVIEVFHIAQMGEELPHDTDNGTHAFVSFFFIVERLGVLYHALNISSIFRNDKVRAVAVIGLKIQLIVNCLLHVK
jgi:hypothetical protein